MEKFKQSFIKTIKWFKWLMPMLIAITILTYMIKDSYIFSIIEKYINNNFQWIIIADLFWSISAWSSINSYIIASSFWKINTHLLVISTFLISWITVWIIQIPVEIKFLWKKFAIIRNLLAFLFAILSAYLIFLIYKI